MADSNVLATQLTMGVIASGVLQFLKSRTWIPWFNKNSAGLNHLFMLLTSAAGAIGVNAVWNGSEHSLTITGLSLVGIGTGLWIWAKQWTVQFLVHRGVFGPVAVAAAPPAPATK
jgi:hypothetical protein